MSVTANKKPGKVQIGLAHEVIRRNMGLSNCTPLCKQCFVTLGVSLNMMASGLVSGFGSVLLPQLKASQDIYLDTERESWIVTIAAIGLMMGVFIVPIIMDKYGRRASCMISTVILCVTFFLIAVINNYHILLILRFFQGVSLSFPAIIGPVLIGEYSSPKYRGELLTTLTLSMAIGILIVRFSGWYLTWKSVAVICGSIAVLDLFIIILSPKSPSFLASCGEYEKCRAVFHWLRGYDEDDELEKIIKTHKMKKLENVENKSLIDKIKYTGNVLKRKEFYKPVTIMFHLYMINEWSGSNLMDTYVTNIFKYIISDDISISTVVSSMDIQRVISNTIAIYIIKKFRRRLVLAWTISLNIITCLLISAYAYAVAHSYIEKCSYAAVVLVNVYVFTIAMGNLPLSDIIAGEIFPLEYRGLGNMISYLFFSLNLCVNMKTALFLFEEIGLHGAYLLYAGIIGYGLVVTWLMLPETKDRTLLDIEDEFRGRPSVDPGVSKVLLDGNVEIC